MRGLLALLPGIISTPSSPPLRAAARLSRRNWFFGFSGPWQRRQFSSRMGLISRAKSIVLVAGGGSLEISTSAANAGRPQSDIINNKNNRPGFNALFRSGFNRAEWGGCLNHEPPYDSPPTSMSQA